MDPRESPDGANSSVLEGGKNSGRTSAATFVDQTPEECDLDAPKDKIMDYVGTEEEVKQDKKSSVAGKKDSTKREFKKPVVVLRSKKTRSRSFSEKSRASMAAFRRESGNNKPYGVIPYQNFNHHSVERLPTLTPFDEERIVWMRNYEDEIALEDERKSRQLSRQQQKQQQAAVQVASHEEKCAESLSYSSGNSTTTATTTATAVLFEEGSPLTARAQGVGQENKEDEEKREIEESGSNRKVGIATDKDILLESEEKRENLARDGKDTEKEEGEEVGGGGEGRGSGAKTSRKHWDMTNVQVDYGPKEQIETETERVSIGEEQEVKREKEDYNTEAKIKHSSSSSLISSEVKVATTPNGVGQSEKTNAAEEGKKTVDDDGVLHRRKRSASRGRKSRLSKSKSTSHLLAVVPPESPPLSAECFIVSRGWQMDQSRLLRALDRIKCATFSRVQITATMNRVVENVRPHLDAVVVHIGNNDLMDATHSVAENKENVASVAGSVATVISRQIIKLASQNRATQFLISLPLPRSLELQTVNLDPDEETKLFAELRRAFNANLKANCSSCSNVQCCENENLMGETSQPDLPNGHAGNNSSSSKYYSDSVQLNSAGMRKLARNWDNFLKRIARASDGQLIFRRASDSGGSTTSSNTSCVKPGQGGQSSSSSSSSNSESGNNSLSNKVPWKPY